jgi:hypothetical protein
LGSFIDVSIVKIDSATTQRRRGDFGAVGAALRAEGVLGNTTQRKASWKCLFGKAL